MVAQFSTGILAHFSISIYIIDHFKEKAGLIEKIKEFYKKQLY